MKKLTALAIILLFSQISLAQQPLQSYEKALNLHQQGLLTEAEIEVKNSILKNSSYLPARILLGKILLEQGKAKSAEKELTLAFSMNADTHNVILPLVQAKLFLHQYEEALVLLNKNEQLNTETDYFLLKGNALKRLDNLDESKRAYLTAINIHGENSKVLTALADLQLKEGKKVEALSTIERALKIESNVPGKMLKAEIHKQNNEYSIALNIYNQILELDKDNKQALFGTASILLEQKKLEEALAFILTLREKYKNDPYAKLLHSSIIAMQGDSRQAKSILNNIQQQFLNLSTEQQGKREVLLLSASVDFINQNFNQARNKFTRYLTEFGEEIIARQHLAKIELKQGNLQDAKRHIDKALELAPEVEELSVLASLIYQSQLPVDKYLLFLSNAHNSFSENKLLKKQYINALVNNGDHDKAIELLNRSDGNTSISSRTLLGFIQLQSGDIEAARKTTQSLLDEYPNKIEVLQLAGELSLKLGNKDDANKLFSQAIVLDEKFRPALLSLAGMNLNEQEFTKTELYYQSILEFYPNDFQTIQLYADLALKQNHYPLAIKLLSAIPKEHPDFKKNRLALLSLYMSTNQLDKAHESIKELRKDDAFNQSLLLFKAQLEQKQGKVLLAQKTLKMLFGLAYDEKAKLEKIALLQLDLKDIESSNKSIKRIAQLNNDRVPDYLKAKQLLITGNVNNAANIITKNLVKQPDSTSWLELEVYALIAQNDLVLAIQKLKTLFEKHQQRSHLQLLSQLYLSNQQLDQAMSLLATWLKKQPRDAWAVAQLTQLAQNDGNVELAISVLLAYPNINMHAIFLNNLANLYQSKDIKQAINYAEKAYQLQPNIAAINDTLGWLLVNNNQLKEGLSFLREAVARDAKNATYHYHLAFTLVKLKQAKQAKLSLMAAQELDDTHILNQKIKIMLGL